MRPLLWEVELPPGGLVEVDETTGGGNPEHHFHPGVLGFSSSREIISDPGDGAVSPVRGSRSSVKEKPGMLRDVCARVRGSYAP